MSVEIVHQVPEKLRLLISQAVVNVNLLWFSSRGLHQLADLKVNLTRTQKVTLNFDVSWRPILSEGPRSSAMDDL